MRLTSTLLACAIASVPVPALAKPAGPFVLPRTEKWEVNYDPDSCSLFAKFGTGDQTAVMRLTQYEPGSKFDLSLFSKLFPTGTNTSTVEVSFGSEPNPPKRTALHATTVDHLPTLILLQMQLDDWNFQAAETPPPTVTREQEAAVTGLSLHFFGGKHYRFEAGSFAKPMDIMRTCLTDLVKHWGYDPAVQAGLTRSPVPLTAPAKWLRPQDYPRQALAGGFQGLVQFRVDVDEQGSVVGCSVLYRTNPDEFAAITCRNLTSRAKFQPALDAQGKPARSFYVGKVYWMISADERS